MPTYKSVNEPKEPPPVKKRGVRFTEPPIELNFMCRECRKCPIERCAVCGYRKPKP